MSNKSRYWTTKSLPLAAFLFGRGAILAGIHISQGEPVFAFVNTPDVQAWVGQFRSGPALIDARMYAHALSNLQEQTNDALMDSYGQT